MQLAIDFGTTNSVVACQNGDGVDILALPGLSQPSDPPLIPSLLYVSGAQTVAGQTVRDEGLDQETDNRLFRNFKRGIVAAPAPPPRLIDGTPWADQDAGTHFIRHLLARLPFDDIDQLVLTAPVASFEGYLAWLSGIMHDLVPNPSRIRLVDESTAAALGYAVTEPGAVVLVVDFGGGTLDLSLVQLPESKEHTGGFLGRFRNPRQQAAQVIAKAGRVLGGSDVDHWLLAEVLRRTGLTTETLGSDYSALLTRCEVAKIALSTEDSTNLTFRAGLRSYTLPLRRADLEALLEENRFYAGLRHVIDKVMHVARQQGIFKEDIQAVLMVGGTSLMPSVQAMLRQYFSPTVIRAHKPFTAVVEGALEVAAGYGLDDYLVHSYGLRHLDDITGTHAYDELIPMGTRYPTREPFDVILGAAHTDQQAVELVIGEIATDTVALVEVRYENGQAVFVAKADENQQQIVPLNADATPLAHLKPTGTPDEDRLKVSFRIDDGRHLRVSVTDLKTRKTLLRDAIVATLR
jgi:molecular chaperone DnaK (HSP70)